MRRIVSMVATAAVALGLMATPALAEHEHFINTPGTCVENVARGQTSIDDASHGGYHRFHTNVHLGATDEGNQVLGQGHSRVHVGKGSCPS